MPDFEDQNHEEACECCNKKGWVWSVGGLPKREIKRVCHVCEGAGYVWNSNMTREEYNEKYNEGQIA